MNARELYAACQVAIVNWNNNYMGLGEMQKYPPIALDIPRYPTGENIRLFGRSGPLSEVIANVVEGRGTCAYWDARKIAAYLEKHVPGHIGTGEGHIDAKKTG